MKTVMRHYFKPIRITVIKGQIAAGVREDIQSSFTLMRI